MTTGQGNCETNRVNYCYHHSQGNCRANRVNYCYHQVQENYGAISSNKVPKKIHLLASLV
jgi:hypothetical protein